MKKLVLSRWNPGLQVVSLIELVRDVRNEGLLSAKRDVESFLNGEKLTLEVPGNVDVRALRKRIEDLGVDVS